MDQKPPIQFIKDNIGRHKQFALGTVDANGNPWVVCVNLAYDKHYNIIWESQRNTEHSKNIARHPQVSICVFSETENVGDFGFYANAVAREVTNIAELGKLLEIRFGSKGKPVPPVKQFLGDVPDRIYFAELKELWLNDDRHLKYPVELKLLKDSS